MRLMINAVGARLGGAKRHLAPFLEALNVVRPEWNVHLVIYPADLSLNNLARIEIHELKPGGVVKRMWIDVYGIRHLTASISADCLVNLTNSGPLWPTVRSILYQRNPIYFDPSWVSTLGSKQRAEAATRRVLAYREISASAAVVTPSEAMLQFLQSWHSWDSRQRAEVIPHAVDASEFQFRPREIPSKASIRLLAVGHPAPHKGLEVAIRALRQLIDNGVNATLTLTVDQDGASRNVSGYTPPIQRYVDDLVTRTRELRLHKAVDFIGSVDDITDLYRSHDLLIFPSHSESFGFPLLEAMASGLPVVASDIPSTREVLAGHGWMFKAGDWRRASDAVIQAMGEPSESVGDKLRKARAHAEEHNWMSNATQVAELVEAVVGDPSNDPTTS